MLGRAGRRWRPFNLRRLSRDRGPGLAAFDHLADRSPAAGAMRGPGFRPYRSQRIQIDAALRTGARRMKKRSMEARRESRFIAFLVLAGVAGLCLSVGLAG